MRQDYSRNRTGTYGIVYGHRGNEYLLVEVLKRTPEGNVLRCRRNTLASGTKEHCQGLIDKFERRADLELIDSFEIWEKGRL